MSSVYIHGAEGDLYSQMVSSMSRVRTSKVGSFLANFELAALFMRWILEGRNEGEKNVLGQILKGSR